MRSLTMLGVGTVTALLLAACGSDGDELSQEEFLAQANEICRVGNEEVAQLADEFFPATGEEPTEEEFQQFIEEEGPEFIDTFVSNVRGQIAAVRDLNGPSDLEDDLDPVLDEASEAIDGIADASPEEFFEGEGEEGFVEVNSQLEELGLATCAEDGEGDEEFCAAAEELEAALEEDPFEGDPETFDERLDQGQAAIEALADAAPDEISQEIDVAASGFRELLDLFREIDDPTDEAEVEAAFEEFFSGEAAAEFDEATDAVNAYALEECGIDLE